MRTEGGNRAGRGPWNGKPATANYAREETRGNQVARTSLVTLREILSTTVSVLKVTAKAENQTQSKMTTYYCSLVRSYLLYCKTFLLLRNHRGWKAEFEKAQWVGTRAAASCLLYFPLFPGPVSLPSGLSGVGEIIRGSLIPSIASKLRQPRNNYFLSSS